MLLALRQFMHRRQRDASAAKRGGGNAEHVAIDPADSAALELPASDAAIRTTLSRLRARYRELIRDEVRRLLDDPAYLDDELAHLLHALRA